MQHEYGIVPQTYVCLAIAACKAVRQSPGQDHGEQEACKVHFAQLTSTLSLDLNVLGYVNSDMH